MRKSLCCITLLLMMPAYAVNLFQEFQYRPLAGDKRATFPGDLLTVLIIETSTAESSANLSSSKDISTNLSASYNRQSAEVSFGLGGKGAINAKTGRNGRIKAALSVRITGLTPDGNYLIDGTQSIIINAEEQLIHLTGIVRKQDISPQNTVLSTRLANAKITYSGDGSVSNSQTHNYIYKVLSFMGLI